MDALWTETFKLFRAKIAPVSFFAAAALPVVFGLIFGGHLGANVPVPPGADFHEYALQLELLVAVGGLVGFGFIFSWLFGREYADGTITHLLALPASRGTIVAAKLVVGTVWCALLAAVVMLAGVAAALALGIPGINPAGAAAAFVRSAVTSSMVIAASLPVAWAATVGRGYLSPLGLVILTLAAGQFSVVLGFGQWMPWAVPAIYSGAPGYEGIQLTTLNLMLPYAAGAAGVFLTGYYWCCTDQP